MENSRLRKDAALYEPVKPSKSKSRGRPLDDSKSLTYFFSTDFSISVQRILTLVAARWSIEALFSDLKEHLGMKDWQVRI